MKRAPRPLMAAAILVCLLGLAGSEVHAQTTLRIEPSQVILPVLDQQREATIEIWADNIPAAGIGSFVLVLDAFNEFGFSPCVRYRKRKLDPDLKAAWGGGSSNDIDTSLSGTVVTWTAAGFIGFPGPSGTVRLGSITYIADAPSVDCFVGKQDSFRWDPVLTQFGSGVTVDRGFDQRLGASWVLGMAFDVDLTLSCSQTSPADPSFFVDGDIITLDCDISNLGADSAQTTTNLLAVFSDDEIIDDGDFVIASTAGVPAIPGGTSTSITLSQAPGFSVAQTTNICVMIDSDSFDLSDTSGDLVETDESNNVQCTPVTILEPQRDLVLTPASVSVSPDPRDPNGALRAGLGLEITYEVRNQGGGAIRHNHRNVLRLGTDPGTALADPNSEICGADVTQSTGLPLLKGGAITQTYGLGAGASTELCKIPFATPPGNYVVVVEADAGNRIQETDPNGNHGPAEGNNTFSVPVSIQEPRPADFRVLDRLDNANDHRVEISGPGTEDVILSVASASDLGAYSLRLTWSPPGLISLGDPNLPGGDPGAVTFSNLLETGGRTQSCAVTNLAPGAGTLDVACASDPSSGPMGAVTEGDATLLSAVFTAVLPGPGTISISNLSAWDSAGQPLAGLRITDGTFIVGGSPSLFVTNPVPPAQAFAGPPFTAGFDLENDGFGDAAPPLLVDVVISRDAFHDPLDPNSEDLLACTHSEIVPLPGKSSASRSLTTCSFRKNVRPGAYTAFYQLRFDPAPVKRSSSAIDLPSRVITLRKTSNGRVAEVTAPPDGPGGTTGPFFARSKRFAASSLASVGSADRNRNWLVRLLRPKHGKRMVQLQELPRGPADRPKVLKQVRISREDKRVLGAADIDGDGGQELILLQSEKRSGDVLDFRRVDYAQVWPPICQTAALTLPFPVPVVAAAGIQMDGDPEDELAVVTADGALALYDLSLTGVPPPASPCSEAPTVILPPAAADLTPLAGDPGFGAAGDEVLSICVMDYGLDGIEEIVGLHQDGSGTQALRVYGPPAAPGGSALLVADDPEFGGSRGRGRALAIACTR